MKKLPDSGVRKTLPGLVADPFHIESMVGIQERKHPVFDSFNISILNKQALRLAHNSRDSSYFSRENRTAAGHCLDQDAPERFELAHQDQAGCTTHKVRQIFLVQKSMKMET